MKRNTPTQISRWLAVLVLLALWALATPLRATEIVYVTTYTGSTLTACPPYCNNPLLLGGVTISTFGSTAISSPPGVPSRTKCTYGYAGEVNWSIQPPTTVAGATYRIEVAHVNVSSGTSNVIMNAFSPDGTMSPSCTNTPVFQKSYGGNAWIEMGYITNNPGVTSPTITFHYVSGQLDNSGAPGNRLYIDAFKFTEIDPCDGVVGDVAISGPLANNQTFVNVTGVTAGATNVTVYMSGGEVGQTNYAGGFAAGNLTVPTSTIYWTGEIKATQTKNGCTSSMPASGPFVGGGANPQIKVSLGCGQNAALTGPAGADTTGAITTYYWVKATGLTGGSGSAPVGGQLLYPGGCWQTVTFDWSTDPKLSWLTGTTNNEPNPYCVFDSLIFAVDDTASDTGPYDIYVDKIMNGDVVIEDFEGWDAGTGVMFAAPNASVTYPPPAATYLASPNSSLVSQANAYSGSNSCRIQWQFQDYLNVRYARVLASRSNGATYPQLDTSKPVTVRYLVLPVGQSTNYLSVGTLPGQTKNVGQPVTFTANAKGAGPFTYQWKKNGGDLIGYTDSSYSIGSVATGDAGLYSVVVDNTTCDPVESSPAQLTVQSATAPVTITGISGTTVDYTGGTGAQFVLLKSGSLAIGRTNWTRVATNPATPGSFTIPAVGTPPSPTFYSIQSE